MVKRIHHVETAILPVVIGTLGTVPINLLGIGDIIASTQITVNVRNSRNTMQCNESLS